MSSQSHFRSRIANRFIRKPDYAHLKKLVIALRDKLIDNPNVSDLAKGSLYIDDDESTYEPVADIDEKCWDSKCDKDERDQFVRRASCADLIADDLLEPKHT
ncbi:hypothetical protein IWW45_008217 [Coemansia sp. RSA 485]|nr:hypothetical protein IWW45_008217 [Coemansia sp. RSA 485]